MVQWNVYVKNVEDKLLGFFLGVFISTFIAAMVIFSSAVYSWFEIVKTLSTLLVAGAFILAVLTYVRQSKWRAREDETEDSKIFCEAAIDGLNKCSDLILDEYNGAKWHTATVHLEETSIVARNIKTQSVRDVYNLKKSVIFTNVLSHIYHAYEFQFSGLVEEDYNTIKSMVRELASTNISSMNESQIITLREELLQYADSLRDSAAIDLSSIVEISISCSLYEHEDVFDEGMINRAYDGISPNYLEPDVLKKAISFIEEHFSSSPLFFYVKFLHEFTEVLTSVGLDRRVQLIGN